MDGEVEWPEFTVMQLQRAGHLLVEDGNHGEYRPRPSEFGTGACAFIRAADMDAGRVLFESAARINKTARDRIIKGVGRGGDILLSHKGTVGKLAMVPPDAPPFVCSPQTTFWRTLDEMRIDRRYLYFFMCSDDFCRQLDARKGETDMADYVSLTAQRELKITLPNIEMQQAIARVLGVLDDKIELNRQMNHALAALARALSKSWFVDFDPVTAKAAGRKPIGMSAATADLFPDSFGDSAVGPIPAGWRVGCFGDIAVNVRAGAAPSEMSPATPYIALEHMPRKNIALTDWAVSDGVMSQKFRFAVHDILFGKLRPYFHKVGIAPLDGVCSTDILVIRAKEPCWAGLALEHAASDEMVQHADATSGGTKMPRTTWRDLARFEIVIPPKAVAQAFTNIVDACARKIISHIHQSRMLAALRDTLLPRLMLGELRLREVERAVEQPSAPLLLFPELAGTPGETIKLSAASKKKRGTTDEFKEAVLIAALVRDCSDDTYPLGRFRYSKLSYLVHRKADHDVRQKYRHKAAGPYSPWTKYQGPEKIAIRNGYIQPAKIGQRTGFGRGTKIDLIDKYLDGRYGFDDAIRWAVDSFHFTTNDDLGLFATVDFAARELDEKSQPKVVANIRQVIASHPEWQHKLDQATFSDFNIARALQELRRHFPADYEVSCP